MRRTGHAKLRRRNRRSKRTQENKPMIGTLSFALVLATMAPTPCEKLKSISLPNTTITTAHVVPARAARGGGPPAGAPRGEGGGGGRPRGAPPPAGGPPAAAGNRGVGGGG